MRDVWLDPSSQFCIPRDGLGIRLLSIVIRKAARLKSIEGYMPKSDLVPGIMEVNHARARLVAPQDIDRFDLKLLRGYRDIRLAGPTAKLLADILHNLWE